MWRGIKEKSPDVAMLPSQAHITYIHNHLQAQTIHTEMRKSRRGKNRGRKKKEGNKRRKRSHKSLREQWESSDRKSPQLSYILKEKDLDREAEMTIRGNAMANSCSMPGDAVYVKSCAMFLATWQSISCKTAYIGPRND